MKYMILALLLVCSSKGLLAQKNSLYADAGLLGALGFSVTGDRKVTNHLGLGAGVQGYNFSPSETNTDEFIPAAFVDVRLNSRVRKRHLFFYFVDMGINFYKHNNTIREQTNHDNGYYSGLGAAYCRVLTKRGGGLYVSLKYIGNSYTSNYYDLALQKHSSFEMNGAVAISLGFRF